MQQFLSENRDDEAPWVWVAEPLPWTWQECDLFFDWRPEAVAPPSDMEDYISWRIEFVANETGRDCDASMYKNELSGDWYFCRNRADPTSKMCTDWAIYNSDRKIIESLEIFLEANQVLVG